jgi:hypothetical protein
MLRRWIMVTLFLSSYLPLFLLIGIRSISESTLIAIVCGVLVLAGALGTVLFLGTARRKSRGRYELLDVEKRDGDVATYLLPFVTVFSGHWRDVLSLAAFIAFLGVIYVRSRLIYVNPLLAFFGYHLWQVIVVTAGSDSTTADSRWPHYLLARERGLQKKQRISAFRIADDLLLGDGEA